MPTGVVGENFQRRVKSSIVGAKHGVDASDEFPVNVVH
jgi:hypothetical protein